MRKTRLYRVATKFRYGSYLAKNGSKNGGIKANTTSSSSKFCQLSKNARLFDLGPTAGNENHVFVKQGGAENPFLSQKVEDCQFVLCCMSHFLLRVP